MLKGIEMLHGMQGDEQQETPVLFPFLCPFPFSFLFSFPFSPFSFSSYPFPLFLFLFLFSPFPLLLLSCFSFPSFFCSPFPFSHFLFFLSFSTPQSHSWLTWASGKPPHKLPKSRRFWLFFHVLDPERGKKQNKTNKKERKKEKTNKTTRNFPLKLEFSTLWHCHRPQVPELNPLHCQKEGKKRQKDGKR